MLKNDSTAIYHLKGEDISPVIDKVLTEGGLDVVKVFFDFADGKTYNSAKEVDARMLKEYGIKKALEKEKPVAVSINVFDKVEGKALMFWFNINEKIMAITSFGALWF